MRFDKAAKTWDDNPVRKERSVLFAKELQSIISANGYKKGMDFGAGTGVTSFILADELEAITLIDYSSGMVEQINNKLKDRKVDNLKALCIDLLNEEEYLPEKFDIIFSLMTLHHIPDIAKALTSFQKHLSPGGMICIADLEKEDGSFHAEYPDFDGHNGFDRAELTAQLQSAGFEQIGFNPFYTITKEDQGQDYPVFLLKAQKKA